MSKTIVDMPKVAQMFDTGWIISMYKNSMGSYTVAALHEKQNDMPRLKSLLDEDGELVTDDFTPEQALTRMAYKAVDGIII